MLRAGTMGPPSTTSMGPPAPATPRTAALRTMMIEKQQFWHTKADESIVKSVTKEELKRQELIFELIATEEAYVRDLNAIVHVRTFLHLFPQQLTQLIYFK